MSRPHPAGSLAAYNSLTDKHLAGYFNNTRIRRHLLRSGLITKSGRILSEKEYKVNIMKQDHQKYSRECLAQAIFRKVLDVERYHQLEIKRKLEGLARRERIQRFKGEHTRRFIEDNMPILTPHPPAGPKTNRGHSVLADQGHSSPLTLTAPRPYTAPGSMQPPIGLQPLLANRTRRNVSKITSGYKPKASLLESEAPFPIGSKMAMMKFRSSLDSPQRADSCQLPHINSYLIPVPPPPPPRAGKTVRENGQEAWRRKRFHPIAAPNGSEPLFTRDSSRIYKASPHSNAVITMVYFGKNVHLSYDDTDYRDEIKIYQQHCGGENLCVYKGKLLEKDNFQFVSKRHCGFPFSLTFFLNGIQVNRLSSCCEFKHRRSSRLGGRRGCFGFVCVEKASPCYKCIIAMGLDRKGSSMKSRRENHTDKREESKKGPGKLRQDRENVLSRRNETEGREALSVSFSAEEMKSGIREVTTAVEEMEWRGKPGGAWDEDRENTFKYDYEEDFEVDEKQDERADEGQADDQMSGKSTSEGEKDNLDPEKETETSSEKAPDADDSEIRERDGCSDSEEEKRDIKSASSNSSRSHSYSSESDDDSAQGSGVTLPASSTGSSPRCSSSPELHGITDPGRSHLPAGHSLEAKMDKQEVTADHVENRPLLPEESHECDPEEGRKKGSQVTAESGPAKSRKPAGQRAKGKVVDRDEGLPGVEDGVGQKIREAEAPSRQHSDTGADVCNAGEVASKRKLETANLGGATNGNLVEKAAFNMNEQSEQVEQETCALEKRAVMEEEEGPQPQDADTGAGLREETGMEEEDSPQAQDAEAVEENADVALAEKAGALEVRLEERNPTVGQLASEQSRQKAETPLSTASVEEADVEGNNRPGKAKLSSTGQAAARDSGWLSGDEAPDRQEHEGHNRQTLVYRVLRMEEVVSDMEQALGEAVTADSTALPSENLQEAAVLREAGTQEGGEAERREVEREGDSKNPDVHQGEDEAPAELEDLGPVEDVGPMEGVGPMEDTASEAQDGSEDSVVPRQKLASERKKGPEVGVPLSCPTGEAEARQMEAVQGSPAGLLQGLTQGSLPGAGSTREGDRKASCPEQIESPQTPRRETGSAQEVTGASALKGEDTLEEQKEEGGEEDGAKEVRSEGGTEAPRGDMRAEDAEPTRAGDLASDAGLLEDSLKETTVTPSEASPSYGTSVEEDIATATELLGQETEAPAQGGEPSSHAERVSGAPGPQPAGEAQASEGSARVLAEAECANNESGSLSGPDGRGEEGPPGVEEEGHAVQKTREHLPEREPTVAGEFGGGAGAGEPLEDRGREHAPRTARWSHVGLDGAVGGRVVLAEEDLHRGGAAETAAGQRVQQREVLAAGVMGTSAGPGADAGPEPKDPEAQASRRGQDAQCAGSAGDGAEPGRQDEEHVSGAAEGGSTPRRGPELSREYLETATTPKLDFSGTLGKHPHMLQSEGESPLNTKEEAVPP